ncbi:MAG: pentapeptide repeat-containing protein, partial [Pseudomonadota bacterium]|nr:pentapeptide repeat-containing protein [Pseudomonadota bacterium]
GADLNQAKLQGASLDNAQLQGAKMDGVYLQGAWALKADLMGASLSGAQLQGTKLNHAQLQGTVLDAAQLQGASLDGAYLWRAGLNEKSTNTIRAQGLMWEQSSEQSGASTDSKPWTNETFLSLKKTIEGDVPAGDTRAEALKRIEILDPGGSFADEAKMPDWRKKIEAATSVEPEEYKKALAGELKALACSGDADARYVVRGLVTHGRIKETGAQADRLVEAILKPDCPVSVSLTEADKAALKGIAKEASGAH